MSRFFNRDVDGILLFDKPAGLSSNQAMQKVRRLFAARKAGHTGSLDPMATGLLPICFGEATKVAGYLLGSRKAYLAECRLGVTTNTDDADGEITVTSDVPEFSDAAIESALVPLRGRITQVPPVYSAIKQGGVPLYKRARRGEAVIVPSRDVEVYRLERESRQGPLLRLRVECGSGTYVRSLARSIGELLGVGAHLTALRRIWIEPFMQPVMFTLETLEEKRNSGSSSCLDSFLLPISAGLESMPAVHLDQEQARRLAYGQNVVLTDVGATPLCSVIDAHGCLIALGEVDAGGVLRTRRGINQLTTATQVDAGAPE